MPKRTYLEYELPNPAIKKQIAATKDEVKIRNIRSHSSERALNLLYQGASKNMEKTNGIKSNCCIEKGGFVCAFCETSVCDDCCRYCGKCEEGFCSNCSFLVYDQFDALCYACFK